MKRHLFISETVLELIVRMSGPVVFQMWMVLVLGTIIGVSRAQVSTAKVMRGNIRRDGELLFHSFASIYYIHC